MGEGRVGRRAFLGGALAGVGVGAVVSSGAESKAAGWGTTNLDAFAVGGWPGAGPSEVSVHWRVHTASRTIGLTFDDGPDPRWTPRVVDLLGEYGARATFFNCGAGAREHPDLVHAARAVGEIGNHSFDHPDLARLSQAQVVDQVDRTHAILTGILGAPPTLFRPPYGNFSGPVLGAAAQHGYRVVLWTDHLRDAGTSVKQDIDRIVAAAAPGRIVLGHDGRADRSGDMARLPGILRGLVAEGYTLVSCTELLNAPDG
jgi:peptidoglycan/xylan/chitin deacetylase (PgdA/CDA1 family)